MCLHELWPRNWLIKLVWWNFLSLSMLILPDTMLGRSWRFCFEIYHKRIFILLTCIIFCNFTKDAKLRCPDSLSTICFSIYWISTVLQIIWNKSLFYSRDFKKSKEKNDSMLRKEVIGIIKSGGTNRVAEFSGTEWLLIDSNWSVKLPGTVNEDGYLLELIGDHRVSIYPFSRCFSADTLELHNHVISFALPWYLRLSS